MSIELKLDTDRRQHDSAVRMTQVVQQFATMLIGRKIGVRLSDKTFAPAWSTSNTIEFSEPQLPDLLTVDGVLSTRGLTFHELSHIMFTPRAQSDIAIWVRDNGYGSAFNALEDQRIETLTVAKYQALTDWLTATMAQYLLATPQAIATAFPLIRGRKYLPVELRALVRQAYVNQQDVAELSDIIDQYRLLLFPQDTEVAKELIARFDLLVGNLPEVGGDPYSHSSRPDHEHQSSIKDKPMSQRDQERARDKARAQDTEVEDESDFNWGEEPEQDEPATNNSPSDNSDTDSDSDGDAEGRSDSDESESDGQSPSDSQSDSSDSHNDSEDRQDIDTDSELNGSGAGTQPSAKTEQVLNDILDSIKDSLGSAIADEIAKFGGDVVLQGIPAKTPRLAKSTPAHVSGSAVQASVTFKHELERLKAQYDPAWERKVRKGRLNPIRYAQGVDVDELFDKFEQGRDDAVDIEAVILLDTSGSMQGEPIQRASESMWGIKRALDSVQANCTVVTFDWKAELLYQAGESASTVMRFAELGGATDPLEALQYANYVLASSDRKIKVLFVITDGAWANAERSERIIKNLRDGGVLTAQAFIGGGTDIDSIDRHECEAIAHVADAKDLLSVGRSVVNLAIARNLVNA